MADYKVTIAEASKELSKREQLAFKDTGDAQKLDLVVKSDMPLIITPVAYVILNVHNEKSDNKDYKNYVIVDKDGQKYVTGSDSFWRSFEEVWETMTDGEEEFDEFSIKAYKMDSKNYTGKQFLTCSIV